MATIAISMVLLAGALPAWRYVMKNEREEELIFRGGQIADAVDRFKRKNGGALPPSLEVLVKGRFLRKLYTDPMTKDGKWRLVRQGEGVGPGRTPGGPGGGSGGTGTGGLGTGTGGIGGGGVGTGGLGSGTGGIGGGGAGTGGFGGGVGGAGGLGQGSGPGRSGLPGAATGATIGGVIGVASVSNEKGLRLFNGRERYSEWLFVAGQPRVVGKQEVGPPRGGTGGVPVPGAGGGTGGVGPGATLPPAAPPEPPGEGEGN